ncbi:MAG: aldo/keto reductase, partial [Candidatus Binatia bacterium]
GVDRIDLIQMHNLVDPHEWKVAMGPGRALEALVEARDQKLVRHIGVTGHGYTVAAMHLKSLEAFPFDSVLLPYNPTMMRLPAYADDFEKLVEVCRRRGIALQTIKSIARRRWSGSDAPHFSWYEPLTDADAIRRGVHYALSRPGFFVNSSSDGRLLPLILEAAAEPAVTPSAAEIDADIARYRMEPLFRAGLDDI